MEGTAIYALPGSSTFLKVSGEVMSEMPAKIYSGFVFHPFRISEKSPMLAIEGPITEWNGVHEENIDLPFADTPAACTTKEDYLRLAHQAVGLCRHGHEKVVTSRCHCLDEEISMNPFDFLVMLREKHQSAFVYCFYVPGVLCYIGASPEILIEQRYGNFSTIALAGTRLQAEERDWTDKERQEHTTVVDYLIHKLENEQRLLVGNTYEQKAGHLVHLRTDLKFKSKEPVLSLAKKLHPTPAICGMPAHQSEKWLHHHEGYDRHYYSGFLGPVVLKGDSHLFVNLRCMQLFRNRVCFYAGGGINALSDPEKEWQETEEKIKVLKSLVTAIR